MSKTAVLTPVILANSQNGPGSQKSLSINLWLSNVIIKIYRMPLLPHIPKVVPKAMVKMPESE